MVEKIMCEVNDMSKKETVTLLIKNLNDAFRSEDAIEYVSETILPQYDWNDVQEALINILLDNNRKDKDYETVAEIIWEAVLDGKPVKKTPVVGLLYYRLGNKEAPYENNLIWSIATKLYDLDYANSEFNPLKDPEILRVLSDYGISE